MAIRKKNWLYIPNQGAGGFKGGPGTHAAGGPKCISFVGSVNSDIQDGKMKDDAPPVQLYDLKTDVNQTTNLSSKHPEIVNELEGLLKSYRPESTRKKRAKK